jgi:putative FmdB family regulatory protein
VQVCRTPERRRSSDADLLREMIGFVAERLMALEVEGLCGAGHGGTAIMPTYVYRCDQCQETFERVETMSEHGASKPRCPKCGGDQVVNMPAPFTAKTTKKS